MGPYDQEQDQLPFKDWWVGTALDDFDKTGAKIAAYGGHTGSSDFAIMAEGMRAISPAIAAAEDPRVALEAAVAFYQLGKVARSLSAYARGELPAYDTLFDETIYSLIARSIRERGGWG